ncbi:MAG: acetolactate synthase small subunit [Bacteroidetes bacterium]|nr:acetolactate synthase small subunit [Bacteroidota bacterium]
MEKKYTISIFSENHIGLLNSITIIFTRRRLNIESINASESEVNGVYRYTVVISSTREIVENVVKQIEKLVEVLGAFMYEEEEIIYREIALYKVPTESFHNGNIVESMLRSHNARIIRIERDYTIIEKTGHKNETQDLLDELRPYGILEFARSGRVAIVKSMENLTQYLKKLDNQFIVN